jgi:hypothetical protein
MARGQPEREAQRDPSSAPPEPPSAQRSLLPLVMVLTVLLLCAVGLVVYFAVTAG